MPLIHQIPNQPGRWLELGGTRFLYCSGTSYLGLATDAVFQSELRVSMEKYGSHFGSSRLGSIRLAVYEEAETRLAKLTRQEAALIVSSGTLAGYLVNRVLSAQGQMVFAPDTHPALWTDEPRAFANRHAWQEYCLAASYQPGPPLFMVSNALDALQVIAYDYRWLGNLGTARELVLVLDESHTLGINGKEGSGVLPGLVLPGHVQGLVLGSMGKGYSLPAGVVTGSDKWISAIWQSPHFGGASPASPAFLDVWLRMTNYIAEIHARLGKRITFFARHLEGVPGLLRSIPDYPVYSSDMPGLAEYLLTRQIFVSHFPYPRPDDQPITRVVLSALHEEEDLVRLADAMMAYPSA